MILGLISSPRSLIEGPLTHSDYYFVKKLITTKDNWDSVILFILPLYLRNSIKEAISLANKVNDHNQLVLDCRVGTKVNNDIYFWKFTPNGHFSTNSSYRFLCTKEGLNNKSINATSDILRIRKTETHNRLQFFSPALIH